MESRRPATTVSAALIAVLAAVLPASIAARPSAGAPTTTLLVKFEATAGPSARAAALARVSAVRESSIPQLGVDVVRVPAASAGAALASLNRNARVTYAERNGIFVVDASPNDPWWPNQTSMPRVRAPEAWDLTTGTATAVIAVLDTGVDPATPDLQGAFVPGWDFVNGDSDPRDDHGHGTMAAGVATARGNNALGVAGYCWSCSLMPVKVMGADGTGLMSNVAAGITWAADHGAKVISMSLTGGGYTTLASAVQYASDRGAVLVAAAGNSGSSSPTYPAAYPSVIGVAGTEPDDSLNLNSNYGSWVSLAAPWCNWGTSARQSDGSYRYGTFCGTSSATPAVAGIAGLALSLSSQPTNVQVRTALESTTRPVAGTRQAAHGRVDARATLDALGGTPAGTAPAASSAPAIAGTAVVGQLLSVDTGTWTGTAPMSYGYQWRRCTSSGTSCSDVSGATAATYAPGSADVGFSLRALVTASNAYGSSAATSNATAAVTAPSEPPSPAPGTTTTVTFSGTLTAKQASQTFSVAVGSGDATATLTFARWSALKLDVVAPDGTVVASVAGPSAVVATASLGAGTHRFVVSGTPGKGPATFSLSVRYATP